MNKPEYVTDQQWNKLIRSCIMNNVNPFLIIAIGIHETGWGALGWGQYGYILGVGCFSETTAEPAFRGYDAQIDWATNQIGKFMSLQPTPDQIAQFAQKIWKPGDPTAWASAVYKYFQKSQRTYGSDIEGVKNIPTWARDALLKLFDMKIINNPFGSYDFYRSAEMLYRMMQECALLK